MRLTDRPLYNRYILILVLILTFLSVAAAQNDGAFTDEALNRLVISLDRDLQAESGRTRQLGIQMRPMGTGRSPLTDIKAKWSVAPQKWATIDKKTGLLTVKKNAPHGSKVTVTASVLEGRKLITQDVLIYDLKTNPLVGLWREESQTLCENGEKRQSYKPIKEFEIKASGTFSVTFDPFETYEDYWGTYRFNLADRDLEFKVEDGNNMVSGVDTAGKFSFRAGKLVLEGIFLGERISADRVCSTTFSRFRQ